MKALHWAVQNEDWGLLRFFGDKDVRQIRTNTYQEYLADLTKRRPDLAPSTKNTLMAAFRNVMKIARDEGAIDIVPQTPRSKLKDNPRPFFRFHPLVSKEDDNYQKLLRTVREMIAEGLTVRGLVVTEELYDLILFLTHSFVRPISSELYAIKHSDVTVADDPRRLIVTDQEVGRSICRTYKKSAHRLATYGTLETTLSIEKIEDACNRVKGMQIFPTSLPYSIHEITLTCPDGDIIQRLQFFPEPNEERVYFSGYRGDCDLIITILQDQVAPDICSSEEALNYSRLFEEK
jgi:hypothetical protein